MSEVKRELTLEISSVHPNLYVVVWRGGPGRVPDELKGLWSKRTGFTAIQNYLDKK